MVHVKIDGLAKALHDRHGVIAPVFYAILARTAAEEARGTTRVHPPSRRLSSCSAQPAFGWRGPDQAVRGVFDPYEEAPMTRQDS